MSHVGPLCLNRDSRYGFVRGRSPRHWHTSITPPHDIQGQILRFAHGVRRSGLGPDSLVDSADSKPPDGWGARGYASAAGTRRCLFSRRGYAAMVRRQTPVDVRPAVAGGATRPSPRCLDATVPRCHPLPCECNIRWLRSVDAYLSQPHMNMCGRPRICIRGGYDRPRRTLRTRDSLNGDGAPTSLGRRGRLGWRGCAIHQSSTAPRRPFGCWETR